MNIIEFLKDRQKKLANQTFQGSATVVDLSLVVNKNAELDKGQLAHLSAVLNTYACKLMTERDGLNHLVFVTNLAAWINTCRPQEKPETRSSVEKASEALLTTIDDTPLYLYQVCEKYPDISIDHFQAAAWRLVHDGILSLSDNWHLSKA